MTTFQSCNNRCEGEGAIHNHTASYSCGVRIPQQSARKRVDLRQIAKHQAFGKFAQASVSGKRQRCDYF